VWEHQNPRYSSLYTYLLLSFISHDTPILPKTNHPASNWFWSLFNLSAIINFTALLKNLAAHASSFRGTRGRIACSNSMLQAGRSRVRFLMRSLDFFHWPNPSSSTMVLGSTQALTTWPPSVSRLSRKYKSLDVSRPVTGIAVPLPFFTFVPQ
jgi:hypothetical protein